MSCEHQKSLRVTLFIQGFDFAKLSFNFNLNFILVESWDGFIYDFSNHSTPPHSTHPKK